MQQILPTPAKFIKFLRKHSLLDKYEKQLTFLSSNPQHPSLNVEKIEPKDAGLYSFRIDRQYRAIFFFNPIKNAIQIIDVNNHYK